MKQKETLNEYKTQIRNFCREERIKRKITQQAVAYFSGTTRQAVSQFEKHEIFSIPIVYGYVRLGINYFERGGADDNK